MAARRPFWKWHRWKSIGFCLWPPSTCIWNLKLKFQSKLDLCSGNHVVYRQTDGRTDGQTDRRTRWIQYTPPPTSLGGGITRPSLAQLEARCLMSSSHYLNQCWLNISKVQWHSSGGNSTRDTKPLPEKSAGLSPVSSNDISSQFDKRYLSQRSIKLAWKLFIKIFIQISQGP